MTLKMFANTSELAPYHTGRGYPYHPIWRAVPALSFFYTTYEKEFNAAGSFMFLYYNCWIPVVAVSAYLVFCFLGPRVMHNRRPYDLKLALVVWNLALSAISFMGSVRILTHLFYLLSPWGGYSFRDTICQPPEMSYADNATGVWCVVFTVSKLFELGDTVFVVLRKKPLIFLHWYHHATVLLCSWFGHVTFTPALYFMGINFTVHAVMYLYFGLMAVGMVPKGFNPAWITVAQISQMFVGIYVTLMSVYYKYHTLEGCHVETSMLVAIMLMYSTYLVLFKKFFVKRYILTPFRFARDKQSKAQ